MVRYWFLFIIFFCMISGCSPKVSVTYIPLEQRGQQVITQPPKEPTVEALKLHFTRWQGTKYQHGGLSRTGVDCSGFTQIVFKINGIKIMRDASQQSTQGNSVNFISEAQPGDLAFFDNDEEEIVHVGIILKENKIIHASGKVRIDNIDHYGIFNKNSNSYTHKLRLIKNYI